MHRYDADSGSGSGSFGHIRIRIRITKKVESGSGLKIQIQNLYKIELLLRIDFISFYHLRPYPAFLDGRVRIQIRIAFRGSDSHLQFFFKDPIWIRLCLTRDHTLVREAAKK